MMSRSARSRRRALSVQAAIGLAVLTVVAIALVQLAPASEERPLVTVYMAPDCDSCRRWMRHLNARGFRTQVGGTEAEWSVVRAKVKVPLGFDTENHATVEGLFIEGFVPARDIHSALTASGRATIRGLVLPGAPPGAPGVESALKQPYVVFAMDANGLLRPWSSNNHFVH